jgi:hypothetical protein
MDEPLVHHLGERAPAPQKKDNSVGHGDSNRYASRRVDAEHHHLDLNINQNKNEDTRLFSQGAVLVFLEILERKGFCKPVGQRLSKGLLIGSSNRVNASTELREFISFGRRILTAAVKAIGFNTCWRLSN